MQKLFQELKIGDKFTCGGNPYIKKSSRTAYTDVGHPAHNSYLKKWYNFGVREFIVEVK
jgi:hypothetical protein